MSTDEGGGSKRGDGRLPALDGVRGVAILLVLLGHYLKTEWNFGFLGGVGVEIFFVLSGFLITSVLLRELAITGEVSLKRFYLRRVLRIVPAYWVFLIAVYIFNWRKLPSSDFLAAFLYLSNYHPMHLTLGHTWSLSVEEQFYLLWPVSLLCFGRTRASKAILIALIAAPLVRIWLAWNNDAAVGFLANADALGVGCLLAIHRNYLATRQWCNGIFAARFVPICAVFLSVQKWFPVLGSWYVVARSVCILLIAVLIEHALRTSPSILRFRPLVHLGRISYSVYLWQQIAVGSALLLAPCLCVAVVSYLGVERPFLRLKEALSRGKLSPPTYCDLAGTGYTD